MSVEIKTENLGRSFGEIRAVDGISFEVRAGEVLGFLGPNGAGKSTTMKMLTCFLSPSFGTAQVGGFDVVKNPREVRELIGYLPENAPLYGEMTVLSFLRFVSEVRGASSAEQRSQTDRVIHLTSLDEVLHQKIETLSKGFKRRVGLAQALIHDPKILILDEPTDGLDPNQKHEVRMLIHGMAKDKCIVLSTHILEEVEEVCTRAVIIAHGRIVADDTPNNLRKRSTQAGAITVNFKRGVSGEIVSALKQLKGVKRVVESENTNETVSYTLFPSDSKEALYALTKEAEQRRWAFEDLRVEPGRLDEVFRQITSGAR